MLSRRFVSGTERRRRRERVFHRWIPATYDRDMGRHAPAHVFSHVMRSDYVLIDWAATGGRRGGKPGARAGPLRHVSLSPGGRTDGDGVLSGLPSRGIGRWDHLRLRLTLESSEERNGWLTSTVAPERDFMPRRNPTLFCTRPKPGSSIRTLDPVGGRRSE